MNNNGQITTARCVRFERLLPGPIERVWEHLTETKLLPGWFGEGVIEHRSGGEVRLMGGHIRGVVIQWNPPRRLVYTWNVFNQGEDISRYPESYLTIELEPRGVNLQVREHLWKRRKEDSRAGLRPEEKSESSQRQN